MIVFYASWNSILQYDAQHLQATIGTLTWLSDEKREKISSRLISKFLSNFIRNYFVIRCREKLSFVIKTSYKNNFSAHDEFILIYCSQSFNFLFIFQRGNIGCVWTSRSWYRLHQCIFRPIKNTFTFINFGNFLAWWKTYSNKR